MLPSPRSISIACWVVVFSPQIIENFRRSSADGLSLQFVIVWLLGDVFNILGAVMQGVLPTMIILAIYYTIADIVLLAQCFYYRGFTWKDEVVPPSESATTATTTTSATAQRKATKHGVNGHNGNGNSHANEHPADEYTSLLTADRPRRGSDWSDRLIHVNPVMPLLDPANTPPPPSTALQTVLWNTLAVLMVIAAGIAGWLLSRNYVPRGGDNNGDNSPSPPHDPNDSDNDLHFDLWGQIFGWLCAVLYLGSRLPQLLLNYRRKSTEGVSMLFFLFACVGNLTYVLSIFAFDPRCWDKSGNNKEGGGLGVGNCAPGEAGRVYGRYILVNLSWLAGSLGTLFLDMGIFAQFFIYGRDEYYSSDEEQEGYGGASGGVRRRNNNNRERALGGDQDDDDDELSIDGDRWEQRPVLERNQSEWSN